MIDVVQILMMAGDGGDGKVSFRREKYVPKGGPDGGDGGLGGNIYLKAVSHKATLQPLAGVSSIQAKSGEKGGKRKMFGAGAPDVVVEVPVGTRVWLLAQNEPAAKRYSRSRLEPLAAKQVPKVRFELAEQHARPPAKPEPTAMVPVEPEYFRSTVPAHESEATALPETLSPLSHQPAVVLAELLHDGEQILLCQGGFGGKGNVHFAYSRQTTPLIAEWGSEGERRLVELELRLLADIGLVGYPSVGKSTLLSVITDSKPKIGAYHFTTIEPNLGLLYSQDRGKSLVIADIPGLIEGASQGKGLGTQFLRHVTHCAALVILLSVPEELLLSGDDAAELAACKAELQRQYKTLLHELVAAYPELQQKTKIIAVAKADLYSDKLKQQLERMHIADEKPLLFSAATGEGLAQLKQQLFALQPAP